MIVTVALSPSVDQTYVVDSTAADHRPRQTLRLAGGNGLNVARAVRALDGDVFATGIVGGASGRWIVSSLEAEGIPFAPVVGRATTRTRMSLAEAGGALTEVYEEPSPVDRGEWEALEEVLTSAIVEHQPTWLVISGLVPPGAPADAVARLLAVGGESGARIAVDCAGDGLGQALAAGTDLVTASLRHARTFTGTDGTPAEVGALLATRAGGDTAVVVTSDDGGAWATFPDTGGLDIVPEPAGPYRHGHHDAFLAGLVHELDRQASPAKALAAAASVAAANDRVPGAGRLALD